MEEVLITANILFHFDQLYRLEDFKETLILTCVVLAYEEDPIAEIKLMDSFLSENRTRRESI